VPVHRKFTMLAAIGAAGSLLITTAGVSGATANSSAQVALGGSHSSFAAPANQRGHVAASRQITFDVVLAQRNEDQLTAMMQAVSSPTSKQYHHYLTRDQFVAQFAATAASADAVASWLRSQGFKATVAANRAWVTAAGTAAQAERAFKTTLNDYAVGGKQIQAAASDLSLPASLAGVISGVSGLDNTMVTPNIVRDDPREFAGAAPASTGPALATPGSPTPIPPAPGFTNAPPCTAAWGAKPATGLPAYGTTYPNPLPYAVCGYDPGQIRKAYGMDQAVAKGIDGTGQTVAITDAYLSSTLASDLAAYANINDRSHPLNPANFTIMTAPRFTQEAQCLAPGWSGEQSLDVEAVHSLAPGAHIVYMGAGSCFDQDLLKALNTIIDGQLAQVISNSWGNTGEATSPGILRAYTQTFSQAVMTGIGVNFSSGDFGDNFTTLGFNSPDFPASDPLVTAVGGTSLALRADGSRIFATGWQTGRSALSGGTWTPAPPGTYRSGAGGGTSRMFAQPGYQVGVVPDKLATANGGAGKWRVVPDVAALGDPTTGFLVGQTQVFANGTYYGQYRIGGTSVASPMFAAMMALADQAAGFHHGFANPILYQMNGKAAFIDITALPSPQAAVRNDYMNPADPNSPTVTSARTLDWNGIEAFGSTSEKITLQATPGYDNMTGMGEPNGMAFLTALG
jgi:subtilase family serine protease